jgi:hypothetical protein
VSLGPGNDLILNSGKGVVMKKNMSTADRIIRFLAGVVLIVLFATNVISGTLGIILLAISAIFIVTSILGFCPAYLPFNISTTKKAV